RGRTAPAPSTGNATSKPCAASGACTPRSTATSRPISTSPTPSCPITARPASSSCCSTVRSSSSTARSSSGTPACRRTRCASCRAPQWWQNATPARSPPRSAARSSIRRRRAPNASPRPIASSTGRAAPPRARSSAFTTSWKSRRRPPSPLQWPCPHPPRFRLQGLPIMCSRRSAFASFVSGLAVWLAVAAAPAAAADQVYFSKNTNVTDILVNYINHETVRLDISAWYLSEHAISIAIVNRFKADVPVRLMGDRGDIYEADPNTKREFYWLAAQGVPIKLRFNPTWFPEINHWKMAIFVGQNTVEFGSGNFAPTELAPVSATNYCDDSELFTSDPEILNAFKTKFDVMWNDTAAEPQSNFGGAPYFKNWNDACAAEPTGHCSDYASYYASFPGGGTPMTVNSARLEPDYPMPADIIWGQGAQMNNRMIQEINA